MQEHWTESDAIAKVPEGTSLQALTFPALIYYFTRKLRLTLLKLWLLLFLILEFCLVFVEPKSAFFSKGFLHKLLVSSGLQLTRCLLILVLTFLLLFFPCFFLCLEEVNSCLLLLPFLIGWSISPTGSKAKSVHPMETCSLFLLVLLSSCSDWFIWFPIVCSNKGQSEAPCKCESLYLTLVLLLTGSMAR